jgi:hypothetical protein
MAFLSDKGYVLHAGKRCPHCFAPEVQATSGLERKCKRCERTWAEHHACGRLAGYRVGVR